MQSLKIQLSVCQNCKYHSRKPSYCSTKEEYVNRKASCPSLTMKIKRGN